MEVAPLAFEHRALLQFAQRRLALALRQTLARGRDNVVQDAHFGKSV